MIATGKEEFLSAIVDPLHVFDLRAIEQLMQLERPEKLSSCLNLVG